MTMYRRYGGKAHGRKVLGTRARLALAVFAALTLAGLPQGPAGRAVVAAGGQTITDLGTLGGASSVAYGINASGSVVGRSDTRAGYPHAFLWQGGTMTDLAPLSVLTSTATAINATGQVAGYAAITDSAEHAFTWHAGLTTDLGTLPAGHSSYAAAINTAGQVAGYGDVPFRGWTGYSLGYAWHPFLASTGVITDIGLLYGSEGAQATGINDADTVVGTASMIGGSGFVYHSAFVSSGGTLANLGQPLGGTDSYAEALNGAGHVVGAANTTFRGDTYHAVLWRDNVAIDLGTLDLGTLDGASSHAYGINAFDQIVGTATTARGDSHAFLYRDGAMTDLNSLLPTGSPWTLTEARGINDAGQIVGTGTINGQEHAFLLTLASLAASTATATAASTATATAASTATATAASTATATTTPTGTPTATSPLPTSILGTPTIAATTTPGTPTASTTATARASVGSFDVQPYDNNVGISGDASPRAANIDDVGYSYSAPTLRSAGIIQGQTVVYHGMAFRWPAVAPGMPDNVIARGQTITPTIPTRGATLAFVGMADHGPSIGTGAIVYDDGSTQSFQLGFSDWTLNGGRTARPSYTNGIVATLPYRNHSDGAPEAVPTYLYEAAVPLQANKAVVAVTLPADVAHGRLHIFAMAVTARPLEQLDQAQLYDGRGLTVAEKARAAQTITVGIGGTLTRVALPFCTTITGSGADLTAGATREPMRSATASITFAHSFSDCAWYTVTFAHPISVAVGEVVRLAVTGRGGESPLWGANAGRGDPYPRGSGTWFGQTIEDFAFQTYVQPPSNA